LVVLAGFCGDTRAAINTASALISDSAAVFASAYAARNLFTGGSSLAKMIFAGPTGGGAIATGNGVATAVTQGATTIRATRRGAGDWLTIGFGNTNVVVANLSRRATLTIKGISTSIPDCATIFSGAYTTGNWGTEWRAAGTQVFLTGPTAGTFTTRKLAATPIANFPAICTAWNGARHQRSRIAINWDLAYVANTALPSGASTTFKQLSTAVADGSTIGTRSSLA
jgi:hypothetical protein